MEYFIIGFTALAASLLTFFSGFGLGTLLTPVLMAFFPVEVAIAMSGIVHLLNNLFKVGLVGRRVDWRIGLKFGIPAVLGALVGALALSWIPDTVVLYAWQLGNHSCQITPLKLSIALVLLFFVAFELVPYLKGLQFGEDKLVLGGLLSGFFGGFSGNQGALRSAFLLRVGLAKETFIATGILIACMIDLTRLSVYFGRVVEVDWKANGWLLLLTVLCAFAGAYLGNKLLKKVTMGAVQVIVTIALGLLALALGLGVL